MKQLRNRLGVKEWLGIAIGVLFIVIGLVASTPAMLDILRTEPPATELLRNQLSAGIMLFRVCSILLGLFIVGLAVAPIPPASVEAAEQPVQRSEGVAHLLILAAILLAALGLRLWQLGAGLWHDEVVTYIMYVKSMPLGEIISTYISENQHFLYSVSARLAVVLFGDSAWALRLPAVLFGVASIGALYLFAAEVSNRREALLAAALMAFSYHHVWFSQNARGYTALLFWTILASWLLIRVLDRERTIYWVAYAVALAFGVYTHTTMLFVALGHFVIYLFELFRRRHESWPTLWLKVGASFFLSGLLTVLLYSIALPQYLTKIVEESTVPAWKNPLWTLFEILAGLQVGFVGGFFVIPAIIVFAIGIWSYLRTRRIVVGLFLLPVIICIVVVVGLGHHLWPRFFFFAMGFGVLIAVRGTMATGEVLARLLNMTPSRGIAVGTALSVAMVVVSALSVPFAYGPKQDFQAALEYVESNRDPADSVAVVGLATFTYKQFYDTDWVQVHTLEELNTLRATPGQTWLVYTFPPEVDAVYPEIMRSAELEFEHLVEFPGTVNSGTVHVVKADALNEQSLSR